MLTRDVRHDHSPPISFVSPVIMRARGANPRRSRDSSPWNGSSLSPSLTVQSFNDSPSLRREQKVNDWYCKEIPLGMMRMEECSVDKGLVQRMSLVVTGLG